MNHDFDTVIDRVGTHCLKWDALEARYGVDPRDGIAMWVADMDFAAPPSARKAVEDTAKRGVYGYFGDDRAYKAAITGWMKTRHHWDVNPDHILAVHGLCSGTALAIQAFSEPGEGVILFTPVYHAFHAVIRNNGRRIVESPLVRQDGAYHMDLEALEAQLTGSERIVILCSPHNPTGRIWTVAELKALAAFCARHDLILVSDEIHHDLLMPGQKHTVAATVLGDYADRLVMLTSASKTFNLAGGVNGNAVIADKSLRDRFTACHMANGYTANIFGMAMTTAAYEGGAEWLDGLRIYLDGNRRIFEEGMAAIPGVKPMPLQSTYLTWIDFSGTGMTHAEVTDRTEKRARVAGNHGHTFGTGGADFLRFNIATRRALVEEAVTRLQEAFGDLQ